MTDQPETTDLVNDLRQMTGMDHVGITAHRAADEIERLRAREAHLLDIVRCYNSDDALFDHEKVVSDVI